jgi:hypothetical protein
MSRANPLRTTAPPARLALRHASGLCTVDADLLDAARRQDEAAHADARWEATKADWAGMMRRLDPDSAEVSRG